MAASVSTIGAVNRAPLNLNGSGAGSAVPSSAFMGNSLKKVSSRFNKAVSGSFKVVAAKEIDESQQTDQDKWKGLAYDISDDQQDITRGKGMVDPLFQAPMNDGTHYAVMSSYEYLSQGLKTYDLDNNMDGFYIAPAFMDKLVVHLTKNFMTLPNIKIPLILGIWGGKGQGKSFQCELVFAKMGINPIMMSAGELESGNAGEPAKLIRQRYREASDIIKKGKMCCLFINDLDAGAGRMGGTTQYTVNNQMVNATLMNIAVFYVLISAVTLLVMILMILKYFSYRYNSDMRAAALVMAYYFILHFMPQIDSDDNNSDDDSDDSNSDDDSDDGDGDDDAEEFFNDDDAEGADADADADAEEFFDADADAEEFFDADDGNQNHDIISNDGMAPNNNGNGSTSGGSTPRSR